MAVSKKTTDVNRRQKNIIRDIIGIALITLGAIALVAILTEAGIFGFYLSSGLKLIFGSGRYIVPLFLVILGVAYISKKSLEDIEPFSFGFALLFLTIIIAIHLRAPQDEAFKTEIIISYGGLLGAMFSRLLSSLLGVIGAYVLLIGAGFASIIFITRIEINEATQAVFAKLKSWRSAAKETNVRPKPKRKPLSKSNSIQKLRDFSLPTDENSSPDIDNTVVIENGSSPEGAQSRLTINLEDNGVKKSGYLLPQMTLLRQSPDKNRTSRKKNNKENISILEQTLSDFNIEAKVDKVTKGPTVTCYELQIASGTKVNKIVNLSDDLALALAAADIRVLAPIPGKSAVGVEVPNSYRELVTLGDILSSPEAARYSSSLAIGIGKNISGESILGDLGEMPHLLIAGATGSGKSISVNSIMISILTRARPDQVRLILIDPKRVELSAYNGLPHLLVPVITKPKEAAIALEWAVGEMERRYETLAEALVRNLDSYNKAISKGKLKDAEPLPYIVVIIDELADLMMVAAGEVEDAICRLAQMARAVGIHLIVATQRPSTDIITGLIKANITSRIAFSVSSQIDSRVILDTPGAEKLIGKGDMLYLAPGTNRPQRIQGAFVSDKEIELVTSFIKNQEKPRYQMDVITEKKESAGYTDFVDELYDQALELVVNTGKASTSSLQRRLRIGYSRAARLIDMLEQNGVVSSLDGSKPRAVLISREELQESQKN